MKSKMVLLLLLVSTLPGISQAKFVEIAGFDIWVNAIGLNDRAPGQPLIVLESGLGTPMDHWDRVLEGLSELGPVLAYDRPGIGKSEPDEELPTIQNVHKKLLALLNKLGQEPPYLLVGHSLGGAYVRGFAGYHPELVAGVIIIDPADFTETQANKRDYYQVLGWDDERIDQELASNARKSQARLDKAPQSIKEESQVLTAMRENDFREIRDHPLPNVPVHILTGGLYNPPAEFQTTKYDREAYFRSKMVHRLVRWTEVVNSVDKGMLFYSADAGHFVHYYDPELLISSVRIALIDYASSK